MKSVLKKRVNNITIIRRRRMSLRQLNNGGVQFVLLVRREDDNVCDGCDGSGVRKCSICNGLGLLPKGCLI